jgi:hypothetical protein
MEWAKRCPHSSQAEIHLPEIAAGSEHVVYLDAPREEVFKATRPGLYGDIYYLEDGVVHQKNCSPIEYLARLRIWKKLFRSAPQELGITDNGQMVTRQKFITGEIPDQETVNKFLESFGMLEVKKQCWLWKRVYDSGIEVWLGDARADNFVKTDIGIVPIDIRLWFPIPA